MSKGERKFILFLLVVILIASLSIIIQIETRAEYDPKIYSEIYSEYESIFDEGDNKNDSSKNEVEDNDEIYVASTENQSTSDSENTRNTQYIDKSINGSTYKVLGKIVIPKIDIKYPIIYTTTDEYLKIAPTKFAGPDVNEVGNLCVVGHNYYNDQFFSRINELNNGDKVFLTSSKGNGKTYVVYDKYEISETDMRCTSQATNGKIELTLITCVQNKKNKRLVVKCRAV